MAHLKCSPIEATECPDVRERGQAHSCRSAAWNTWVRLPSPCLTVGILVCIAAAFALATDHDAPSSAPDLPPLARTRIETRGGIVAHVMFHPTERVLFSGDALIGEVLSWDLHSGMLQTRFEKPFPDFRIQGLTLATDGRALAACLSGKGVVLWDTGTGGLTDRLAPECWDASTLAFAPDGRTLVAAGWDGTIRVWDKSTRDPRVLWSSRGEGGWTCLAISPDGRTLAAGGLNGWLRRWDLFGGRPLSALEGDGSSFRCLAYSPDGRTLASGSWRGRIWLWDAVRHRECLGSDQANLSSIVCLAYAPDGRCLATGHEDRVVRLWDPETGKLLHALKGHRHSVRSLAFTPEGRELASGSSDSTILLWDLAKVMPSKADGEPTLRPR
jgi:WD40 repeat protein